MYYRMAQSKKSSPTSMSGTATAAARLARERSRQPDSSLNTSKIIVKYEYYAFLCRWYAAPRNDTMESDIYMCKLCVRNISIICGIYSTLASWRQPA